MSETQKPTPFWKAFMQAVGVTALDITVLRGASGLQHNALCVGLDEPRKRLIFVSSVLDPRVGLLVQNDLQVAFGSFHVIIARTIQVDAIGTALKMIESTAIDADPSSNPLSNPDILSKFMTATLEPWKLISKFKVLDYTNTDKLDIGLEISGIATQEELSKYDEMHWKERNAFLLSRCREYDHLAEDVKYGICPVPLYALSEEQFGCISEGHDMGAVQEILRQHGILQYFLPPPDHLALGLLDRGIGDKNALLTELRKTPREGHPYGKAEITDARTLLRIVDELRERGLTVEGGYNIELSEKGTAIRQTVKFRPREGLVSKVINRFKITIDLKNIFGIGQ